MPTPNTATPTQPAQPAPTSAIAYTPPQFDPGDNAAFDSEVRDVISQIEDEFAPQYDDPDAGGQAPEAAPVEPEEGEDTAQPEQEAEPEEGEPSEDPALTRGMERLVQREVAVQTREAAISAREAKLASQEAELAGLRARLPALEVMERFATSPLEAVKALGHDPGDVIKTLVAEKLQAEGQPVPPELTAHIKESAADRRIRALEKQLAEKAQADQAATYLQEVVTGAREYVTKQVGAAKHLPTLAHIAKVNPEHAHREILEEITRDAQSRMAADPNGEPLAYEEAAKRVEKRLAGLKALFGPAASTTPEKQAPGAAKKNLNPSTTKPPARPLAPWLNPEQDIYSKGLQEAEREFHRTEAARKARR